MSARDLVDSAPRSLPEQLARYKIPIILGGVSLLLFTASVVLLVQSTQIAKPIEFLHSPSTSEVLGDEAWASDSARMEGLKVDVAGAVMVPGVYALPAGARVEDAIQKAGGLRADADTQAIAQKINRALKVTDGMKIYIPVSQETSQVGTSHIPDCSTSHGDVVQSCAVVATPGASSQNGAFVSLNFSSQSELESLPGVGPVTATKIIAGRPYSSVDELLAKKIVGQSVFEKIKNSVSL